MLADIELMPFNLLAFLAYSFLDVWLSEPHWYKALNTVRLHVDCFDSI